MEVTKTLHPPGGRQAALLRRGHDPPRRHRGRFGSHEDEGRPSPVGGGRGGPRQKGQLRVRDYYRYRPLQASRLGLWLRRIFRRVRVYDVPGTYRLRAYQERPRCFMTSSTF